MRYAVLLLFLCFVPVQGASAQGAAPNAAALALEARDALDQAAVKLDAAKGARDRVVALTETIHAFEDGLGAMREGLRQAAIRERQLSQRLAVRNTEIAGLLGTLQTVGRNDSPAILIHPQGAMGTARGAMLLAEVGPALNAKAGSLRSSLEEVQTLRQLQQSAAERMSDGLSQVQQARAALNQAMAERTDLPKRFTADPVRAAILIASAETLDGFASGLSQIALDEIAPPDSFAASAPIGRLRLPVQAVALRRAGEADTAGVVRPGLLLATRPQALVTAPFAATLRYVGPLLDFGQVVILEPQAQSLVILAGLGQAFGEAGQVISEGTPLGLMGGDAPEGDELLSTPGEGAGTDRSETLYIEVRQDNRPIDPETWFDLGLGN